MTKNISPIELLNQVGLVPSGPVIWETVIPENRSGVYVISIDAPECVDQEALEIEQGFWKSDQSIVYIGRAKCLSKRLKQFYVHKYGNHAPHRGGQAILKLDQTLLRIYWAVAEDYAGAENQLITKFEEIAKRKPFANRVRSARMKKAN